MPGQHLVANAEVEVVAILVLGYSAQCQGHGDRTGLTVVDGRAPRGPTPSTSDAGPVPFPDVHVTVRAAVRQERREPAQGEALECHLYHM